MFVLSSDDYMLSNGILNYLTSAYAVTRNEGLPEVAPTDHSVLQDIKVCWNIHDSNHYIMTYVYGKKDKRFKRNRDGGSDLEDEQFW